MRARLTKDFRFEAAHTLPSLPADHKCRQMHGHSFKVEISIEGEVDETIGWVYDHKRISDAMRPLIDQMDHGYLNAYDERIGQYGLWHAESTIKHNPTDDV